MNRLTHRRNFIIDKYNLKLGSYERYLLNHKLWKLGAVHIVRPYTKYLRLK